MTTQIVNTGKLWATMLKCIAAQLFAYEGKNKVESSALLCRADDIDTFSIRIIPFSMSQRGLKELKDTCNKSHAIAVSIIDQTDKSGHSLLHYIEILQDRRISFLRVVIDDAGAIFDFELVETGQKRTIDALIPFPLLSAGVVCPRLN